MVHLNNIKIGIIGHPRHHHNREVFLKKLTKILGEICHSVHVVGPNQPATQPNIVWTDMGVVEQGLPNNYLKNIQFQINAMEAIRNNGSFNLAIIRATPCIVPNLYAQMYDSNFYTFVTQMTNSTIINLASKINIILSDQLIVESESVLNEWGIQKYSYKSNIGATYVDSNRFNMNIPPEERNDVIGYLGTLDHRKGVDLLLRSIDEFFSNKPDSGQSGYKFRFGGTGPLTSEVEDAADKTDLIEYLGYIPDNELNKFYNRISILILPTESEGLPNVALEAMACGTPVLATPVGGLPDIINDGETGFLMPDNDPETIANHVQRAMNFDELPQVSENARILIEEKYRFDSAVDRYRQILQEAL